MLLYIKHRPIRGADVVSADETRIERFFYQARKRDVHRAKEWKSGPSTASGLWANQEHFA